MKKILISDGLSEAGVAVLKREEGWEVAVHSKLAPGDLQTQAHLVLTRVLVARGEFADAVAALDAAVKKDGDNPLVHLLRARILTNLGRKQEAIEDYRRVEKLAPDTDVGQAARLERLQIEGPGTGRITSPAS